MALHKILINRRGATPKRTLKTKQMQKQKDLPAWQFAIIFFVLLYIVQIIEQW